MCCATPNRESSSREKKKREIAQKACFSKEFIYKGWGEKKKKKKKKISHLRSTTRTQAINVGQFFVRIRNWGCARETQRTSQDYYYYCEEQVVDEEANLVVIWEPAEMHDGGFGDWGSKIE